MILRPLPRMTQKEWCSLDWGVPDCEEKSNLLLAWDGLHAVSTVHHSQWLLGRTVDLCSAMVTEIHVGSGCRFRTVTNCPNAKCRVLACWSWWDFCLACFSHTFCCRSGLSNSKRVDTLWPRNRVHGATPVVAWGIVRYESRKFCNHCCSVIPLRWVDFSASLAVRTKRSATHRSIRDGRGCSECVSHCFPSWTWQNLLIWFVAHRPIWVALATHVLRTTSASLSSCWQQL